jgi:glycosyltransferase involved in cell wall biosynthesis
MINLWYEDFHLPPGMNGPRKLLINLKESLIDSNIPFSVNSEKYKINFLVHYDEYAYPKHEKLEHSTCFIGPQFWPFNDYGKFLIEHPEYYNKIIVPSKWVENKFIDKFNFPKNKICIWPVGIEKLNTKKEIEFDCLIYFKRRSTHELKIVEDFFASLGISYQVISYGNYQDDDLEKLCSKCKFCFLLNGTESQGIAVQQIMSSNTPLLVWDVTEWTDQGEEYKVSATSIPYWSDECGKVFYDRDDIEITFFEFCDKINEYNPRKYIEENLSFEKSVKKLMEIIND